MRVLGLLAVTVSCAAPSVPAWSVRPVDAEFLLLAVDQADADCAVAVGGDHEDSNPVVIVRSTDGAKTWQPVATGPCPRLYAVHFPEPDTGYAVGLAGTLLATADGGATWSRRETETDAWLAGVWFVNRRTGFLAGSDADGAVLLRTADGGQSFESVASNLPAAARSSKLRDIRFVDPAAGFITGTDGVLLATFDGGVSWEQVATNTSEWVRAVHFPDTTHGFAIGARGSVLHTRDGGHNWSLLAVASGGKFNDIAFDDRASGWATTMSGVLLHTADGGVTWEPALVAQARELVGLSCSTRWKRNLCVGGKGLVLRH